MTDAAVQVGMLVAFSAKTVRVGMVTLSRGRFAWKECLEQSWFLTSVSAVPALLMTIPLGVMVAVKLL